MGEDRTGAHSVGRDRDRLTIAEAATLLGVHKNTVRNRIKNGSYRAEMVQTERGPTYLIERESLLTNLTTNTLSSASQELVSQSAMEFVQELLRPFVSELGEVREELGAERARRQIAEERVAVLEAELEAFRETRESPETVEEAPERAEPHSATEGAQEGTERPQQRSGWLAPVDKLPWWHYVLGLFLVTLASYLSDPLYEITVGYGMPGGVGGVAALLMEWLPPGVFGVWVGFRRENPRFRSQIIPFGILVGLANLLGSLDVLVQQYGSWDVAYASGFITGRFLPAWLFYVSGALIGSAWQRRRTGRLSDTTSASPMPGSNLAFSGPRTAWTPRQQAILGFAGTVVASLISLMGTIVSAIMASGG